MNESLKAKPDFWALHAPTGAHIGLWANKADVDRVVQEYMEGGIVTPVVTPLYLEPPQPSHRESRPIYDVVEEGFANWAAKPHNKKWAKRIDGTPIQNDLTVNIGDAVRSEIANVLDYCARRLQEAEAKHASLTATIERMQAVNSRMAEDWTKLVKWAEVAEEKLEVADRALDFVASWMWRETALSDGERLSAVMWHPTIKARALDEVG